MNNMPGKRYRKNKEVYMWHLASPNPMNWSVAITPEDTYWSNRIWKDRSFKNFPDALAYAKKLANALGNGQRRIKVIGSPFVNSASLDGSEVVTHILDKPGPMIDMDVDRAIAFAQKAWRKKYMKEDSHTLEETQSGIATTTKPGGLEEPK